MTPDPNDVVSPAPRGAEPPRVVIVGGGFGGLYAARGLAHAPLRVTIVDQHNYHLFRPMLYQVATGLLSADEVAAPIRSILRRQRNADVLMGEVSGVDTAKRLVRTRHEEIPYDYLILATGIRYNYFGHDEWKPLAPGLDSVDDADHIRGRILMAFEEAERLGASSQAVGDQERALLTFVLVGAGTAGVEMAGTIAEMARIALVRDFRHVDLRSAHILLFEAAPRILPTYPEDLAASAHRHLESLGVEVRTGSRVESVDREGVVVNGRRIACRTVLWSAGVTASGAGDWIAAATDHRGRVRVGPDFSIPGLPDVFVIGDAAVATAHRRNLIGIRSREPSELPGVAQPAIQAGKYVASVIARRVAGRTPPPAFCYWDKGSLAIVGRSFAVADLGVMRFAGFAAWLIWIGVHIFFLIGFANRLLVMLQWGISFLTKRRGVRIFPMTGSREEGGGGKG